MAIQVQVANSFAADPACASSFSSMVKHCASSFLHLEMSSGTGVVKKPMNPKRLLNDGNQKPRARRVIKLGTDFTGMNTAKVAMSRILPKDKWRVVFGSEILPACLKLQEHMLEDKPDVMYADVSCRDTSQMPEVDVYVWTPPCQPYSASGSRKGVNDDRGKLLGIGVRYCVEKRPKLAIMENVAALAHKKHKFVLKGMVKILKEKGYAVHWKLLNALDFHVCQQRNRLFLVAIRLDCVDKARRFKWPESVRGATLDSILDDVRPSDKPGRIPKTLTGSRNVKAAMRKVYDAGTNPLKVPVAIDADCSARFAAFRVNEVHTLTRSRGKSGGPWISTRGRRTTTDELLKVMGFKVSDVPWQKAGLRPSQINALLGNGVPVPMIGEVMSHGMYAAGIITADSFKPGASLV